MKNKRKKELLSLILVVGVSITKASIKKNIKEFKELNEKSYRVVVIEEGDTLWGIYHKYPVGNDLKKYIKEVEKINGIKGSVIQAGQKIIVPSN